MDWLNSNERAWEHGYCMAKNYFDENGNLNAPFSYQCYDGYALGSWLHEQRKQKNKLRLDYKERLIQIV